MTGTGAVGEGRCETCRFFGARVREPVSGHHGSCRRYAPRGPVVDFEDATGVDYFPPVRPEDWCGEYERREG